MQYSFKQVADRLAQDVDRVVPHLLPNAKRIGSEWRVGSINGEIGDSLGIHCVGSKVGVWCDFATGQAGDLLELWRQVKDISTKEAMVETMAWLGIKNEPPKILNFNSKNKQNFERPNSMPSLVKISSVVGRYLSVERKLTPETLFRYQVGEYRHKGRNVISFPSIIDGELVRNKVLYLDRPNGKKEFFVTPKSEPCLFGWHMVSSDARSVAIFEGEIDAMTAHQYGIVRFNSETKTEEPIAMLSVPFGGGSGNKQKWVEYEFDRLAVFDEIYLCMDLDVEGQLAGQELITRLGRHRCSVVKLPYKDANECLQKDVTREDFQKCFRNAKSLDPEELVSFSIYQKLVKDRFLNINANNGAISTEGKSSFGYTLPWKKTWEDILLRPSELSVWTGTNGHGKSLLLGYLMLNCIKQGAKVCIASLEMKPVHLSVRLIRQFTGLEDPSEENIDFAYKWLDSKLFLFNHVGNINGDTMLEVFRYANHRYGVNVFLIDSLMKCGIPDDDWAAQKTFIDKLCDFKNDNNCHIHLVAHARKSDKASDFKDKMDIKGSGAITDLADNVFSVYRNIGKEREVENLLSHELKDLKKIEELKNKQDVIIECSKQRNGEWDGLIHLWFDRASFQYFGGYSEKAKPLVDFSIKPSRSAENKQSSIDDEEWDIEIF